MADVKGDIKVMRKIAKIIRELDTYHSWVGNLGSDENVKRENVARKNLVNILFSNGYELQQGTMRLIKSKSPRKLLE
jgi:hypothetical protein